MASYNPANAVAHMPKQQFYIGVSDISYSERMREYNASEYLKNRPTNKTGISAIDDFCHDVFLDSDIKAISDYDTAYIEKHGSIPEQPHCDDLIVFNDKDDAINKCPKGKGAFEVVLARNIDDALAQVSREPLLKSLDRNARSNDWIMDY